jgi:hypothetical protein
VSLEFFIDVVAQLVEALRFKLEGRGFDLTKMTHKDIDGSLCYKFFGMYAK